MTDPWISYSDPCYQCFSMRACRFFYQTFSPTVHMGGTEPCHVKSVPCSLSLQYPPQLASVYCLERE